VIKSLVAIHDRTQLQLIFDYLLLQEPTVKNPRSQHYKIDLFLFYPPQMHVLKQNYPKSLFYSDLRTLIRLREPGWNFQQFIDKKGTNPLERVQKILDKDVISSAERAELIETLRIFGCLYSTYISRKKRKRRKLLHKENFPLDTSAEERDVAYSKIISLLGKGWFLLHSLMELEEVCKKRKNAESSLELEFALCIEYGFFLFQKMVTEFSLLLEPISVLFYQESCILAYKKTRAYTRLCYRMARSRNYPLLKGKSTREELEAFDNRVRFLKQRMEQPMYLYLETPRLFLFRKQLGLMLAAGAAATWTFMANILIFTKLKFSGFQTISLLNSDGVIGLSTLFILLSFVLAYVLQEQIKEIGRSRFMHGVWGSLPDHQERLFSLGDQGELSEKKAASHVGTCEETCHFISPQDPLIEKIQALRGKMEGANLQQETIIHYKREVSLHTGILRRLSAPVTGIRDNIRLNIRRFLPKLDEPYYKTSYVGANGKVEALRVPKNYHLDVVLLFSEQKQERKGSYMKRLILNKDGLLRVEDFS